MPKPGDLYVLASEKPHGDIWIHILVLPDGRELAISRHGTVGIFSWQLCMLPLIKTNSQWVKINA